MCSKQYSFCHDSIMATDYQEGLQEKDPFHKDELQSVHGWPFKFVTVKDAWSKPADSQPMETDLSHSASLVNTAVIGRTCV